MAIQREWTAPLIHAESIVRTLSEPVLVLDYSLRAVLANPAFYSALEITPGELEGKSIKELIGGEDGRPRLQTILQTVVDFDHSVDRVDVECMSSSGTRKIFSVSARRFIQDDDLSEMVLVELRDVTVERKTASMLAEVNDALLSRGADLERINLELDAFNRWVSHDLRTPLRFINTVAHRVLESHGPELPAGVEDSIRVIMTSTQEMGKLIEDLLAFAKVDRVELKRQRTNLSRLARQVVADLKREHEEQDVTVVIDDLPICIADRALMKQVLINLLSNAMNFTKNCKDAKIHLGINPSDKGAVYFVRDNGVGFDMRDASRLFLPFHRLHRSQELQGTGVGLTLVKRIVERHGGRVWAEGKPSEGATFYFYLGD